MILILQIYAALVLGLLTARAYSALETVIAEHRAKEVMRQAEQIARNAAKEYRERQGGNSNG